MPPAMHGDATGSRAVLPSSTGMIECLAVAVTVGVLADGAHVDSCNEWCSRHSHIHDDFEAAELRLRWGGERAPLEVVS